MDVKLMMMMMMMMMMMEGDSLLRLNRADTSSLTYDKKFDKGT